jgi:hypothetical protein
MSADERSKLEVLIFKVIVCGLLFFILFTVIYFSRQVYRHWKYFA